MRLLDLYCGAGGCAMGYFRAGFTEIVGVDLAPQPNYPFEFRQWGALDFLRSVKPGDFDLIHASPPCQRFSAMSVLHDKKHPDLLTPTRAALVELGTPFVIENVPGAPLPNAVVLCGTMFGLQTSEGSQLRRHRLFETPDLIFAPPCAHNTNPAIGVYGGGQHPLGRLPMVRRPKTIGVWGNAGGHSKRDGLDHYGVEARKEAMGIDWMTGRELVQAIPPAYTEFLGRQILAAGRT